MRRLNRLDGEPAMPSVVIYGAQGYTGGLALAAARDAVPVVPASRRAPPPNLDGGPAEPWTVVGLDDPAALRAALGPHAVVLNCAGPFAHTWRPLVEACFDTRTHYLDLCAEWAVFEAIAALEAPARERGVMLLPGVGFDVVASDCLAAHVARRLPDARRLQIGIAGLELFSRGSARTVLDLVGEPVRVRRGGVIVAEPALLEARFDFGAGPVAALAVSWGDVSTAFHTTGIPDVEVYFEATPLALGLSFTNRSVGWMLRRPFWRRLAEAQLALLPPGPPPTVRAVRRATLVARAEDAGGGRAEARLGTPEAYSFSVAAALAVTRGVLEGEVRPGFQTPARWLGPDFVLGLEGVERKDLA
jgi:short subunit dehydrogenase-like uncharacterized protein